MITKWNVKIAFGRADMESAPTGGIEVYQRSRTAEDVDPYRVSGIAGAASHSPTCEFEIVGDNGVSLNSRKFWWLQTTFVGANKGAHPRRADP